MGRNRIDGGVPRAAAGDMRLLRPEIHLSAAAGTGLPHGIPRGTRAGGHAGGGGTPFAESGARKGSDFGEAFRVTRQVPEPKREIDRRALFPSAANNKKDTLAHHTSSEPSNRFDEGHASGNTMTGSSDGEPSARLAGRNVVGSLPLPPYGVQKSGRVVVRIRVDREGNVTEAIPGIEGTTVQDRSLWNAAKNAALQARFNANPKAPLSQEGTITYIFKLQ